MRVTYNWLQDYVDLDLAPEDLAERLTMVGLEVEELLDRYAYLDRVVVARVAEVEAHPHSGHLKVCQVEAGKNRAQVVCGAPNVEAGMLSAWAAVGAELPSGEVIAETEIRGVRSTGMLCSEAELVLGPDTEGIMSLPETARPGQGLKEALGLSDWVFEIGVTPNRADSLCVVGLAREVAALLGRRLKYPSFEVEEGPERVEDLSSVEILDPEHCPRYVARVIQDLQIAPAPFWMVERLIGVGIRPINNVVDITNFILMELGQPLHAFDLDRLEERRIVVKTAREGERFVTLDSVERIMGPEMLMICDGRQAVALAGVMGGLNSEITSATRSVLLESAYFNPVSIRRTSKTLGLSTEASFRFERDIGPDLCVEAADRAAALMNQLAGGRVAAGRLDVYPRPRPQTVIRFSPERCNRFLGTRIKPEEMAAALRSIELEVREAGEEMRVEPPSFRVDLTREVDLFEEVARLVGFDQVPVTLPPARAEAEPMDPVFRLRAEAGTILEGLGLSEVITYSFISGSFGDKLGLPPEDLRRRSVRVLNPLSEEQALMRTTLIPGLLEVLARNQAHHVWDVAVFEAGRVFFRQEGQDLPEERLQVSGLLAGTRTEASWLGQAQAVDFYTLKGVVQDLLKALRLPEPDFARQGLPAYYDPTAAAAVSAAGQTLGWLGRLAGPVAAAFALKDVPFVFELDLATLQAARTTRPTFSPLPRFPSVSRDLALVLDQDVEAGRVLAFIRGLGEEFLTEVSLFDLYQGRQVGPGQKSLALRLVYRSRERTLTDEEVNAVHQRITNQVLSAFKARLRS